MKRKMVNYVKRGRQIALVLYRIVYLMPGVVFSENQKADR